MHREGYSTWFMCLSPEPAAMDSSYPDPGPIGRAFVKQYYTQLHHDPAQMHRFYLEQSSMVHGGSEVGSAERVIGQKVTNGGRGAPGYYYLSESL